jgi:hypothetical protein
VAPHHRDQMGLLVRDGLMPIDPTPSRHRRQRSGVTVLCRYLPHHILSRSRLAPDVGEAEKASPSAGSPDRPSLHLRERNSSMKNRTRESCTSGSVSGGAVALAAGLPSERLEVIEHSGNQFLSPWVLRGQRSGKEKRASRAASCQFTTPPGHVLGDGRLGDRKSELEQFTMNAWRTPKRVLQAHAPINARSSAPIRGRPPREGDFQRQ